MLAQFAISTSPIIHLVCPQKFVYNFSSLLGSSGHKKKRAREKTTRESPSRAPIILFAHYFQAPATHATISPGTTAIPRRNEKQRPCKTLGG